MAQKYEMMLSVNLNEQEVNCLVKAQFYFGTETADDPSSIEDIEVFVDDEQHADNKKEVFDSLSSVEQFYICAVLEDKLYDLKRSRRELRNSSFEDDEES